MKISILLCLVFFICLSSVSCASTAVDYVWGPYTEEVCTGKWFCKKECKEVEKVGWIPKTKYKLRGVGVEADFDKHTVKGGSFIPDIPLKVNN